jgi:hypothetical protein
MIYEMTELIRLRPQGELCDPTEKVKNRYTRRNILKCAENQYFQAAH